MEPPVAIVKALSWERYILYLVGGGGGSRVFVRDARADCSGPGDSSATATAASLGRILIPPPLFIVQSFVADDTSLEPCLARAQYDDYRAL